MWRKVVFLARYTLKILSFGDGLLVSKRCKRCRKAISVDTEAKYCVCSPCSILYSVHINLSKTRKNPSGISIKEVRNHALLR